MKVTMVRTVLALTVAIIVGMGATGAGAVPAPGPVPGPGAAIEIIVCRMGGLVPVSPQPGGLPKPVAASFRFAIKNVGNEDLAGVAAAQAYHDHQTGYWSETVTVGNDVYLKAGKTRRFEVTLQPVYRGIGFQFTAYLSVPVEDGYFVMHANRQFSSLGQVPLC